MSSAIVSASTPLNKRAFAVRPRTERRKRATRLRKEQRARACTRMRRRETSESGAQSAKQRERTPDFFFFPHTHQSQSQCRRAHRSAPTCFAVARPHHRQVAMQRANKNSFKSITKRCFFLRFSTFNKLFLFIRYFHDGAKLASELGTGRPRTFCALLDRGDAFLMACYRSFVCSFARALARTHDRTYAHVHTGRFDW